MPERPMYKKISKFFYSIYGLTLCLLWQNGFADSQATKIPPAPSLGGAATNMLEPLGIFTNVLYNIFYIVGVMCLGGAIIRYKEYRENPSQTRLSTPIFLLIIGGVFIALPFIARTSPASTAVTG